MRILQLTPRVASPPTDGGRVVMLQVAQSLRRLGADVEVLSLNPRKQHVENTDAINIDTSRHFAALLRSFTIGAPQLVARFYSPEFDAILSKRARDFDVVQLESPFMLPYVRSIREHSRAKIVLRSLNVEFRIWERLAANEPNILRRIALQAIARSLRNYEIAQLNACDAIVPITEADADDFRALGCTRPIFVLPGGVELDDIRITRGTPNTAGFLGSLDYRPNQEAALWLAEQLRLPSAQLHIAGSRAPEWLRARLRGVNFHGEVDDANAFIRDMRVMLAPIFSGGGMRIKILAAMAAGKPVVSTTIGAEGIDVIDGVNIVMADDAASFANAIDSLMRDDARAFAIGDAARELVATRYSVDALTRGLLAFYEELTQRRDVR